MAVTDEIREALGVPELRGLWEAAREALSSSKPTFRLELPDDATRTAVGELYGRPMWGEGTRISVSKLDEALRNRFGAGLSQVVEALSGAVAEADPVAEEADELLEVLDEHGLAGASWAAPWLRWVRQYGRVGEAELTGIVHAAARVLAAMSLSEPPRSWTSRASLAGRIGFPHSLDDGTALSRVVLKAAALAQGVEAPGNERDRRALWERCGVSPDGVSATVLTWALPVPGDDAWSAGIRARTELGLPAHLTHLDLGAAPARLVPEGTAIAVCEHPRVVEAAIREALHHPVLCLSGLPSTAARALLERLSADGAVLHVHADFDWPGIAAALTAQRHGAVPWRMSGADYRSALDRASQDRTDLPNLIGTPIPTPWDPQLADLMTTAARAVEEEHALQPLLDDLRRGL
ncbi:DUF2399 domain-containing protein [Saccharopolyspora sp. TS4A08]|uniref:DUF2399 domain-containing protein n=1 Tax=Saccharopolyspora ipomoeae TaxID=3042027 RepID=A0ABT6PXN1_9PSEU|nr:DUF2399 domain-containing protein [Saccharopolyspora sp. TS4A08]MDI2032610.1 DUF2399 domain-containing protein [Saccharopolyspora sp. TS4A08]